MNTYPDKGSRSNGGASCLLGMDIGGTHVSTALVSATDGRVLPETKRTHPVDARGDAETILTAWCAAIRESIAAGGLDTTPPIGVAMPGPFDYPNGISLIKGLDKFEALYGMNVREELARRLSLPAQTPVRFQNDAACFLLGECWSGAAKGHHRAIGITLGTGLGSAFVADGELVESGDSVPENGWLYNVPFRGRTGEEWFAARALLAACEKQTGKRFDNVRALADATRAGTLDPVVFQDYGAALGEFLRPWAERFEAECLVIGGNISRAMDLFGPTLREELGGERTIKASTRLDDAAIIGAASLVATMQRTD